jgi:ureidoglycolate hydrolase
MSGLHVDAEPLDADAFRPFGGVFRQPERPQDAEGPGWRWWGETLALAGDARGFGLGYLDLQPTSPPSFDWAERHMRSPELVAPLHGDCLVYAAPAEHPDEPGRAPAPERFRAFRVRSGEAVLLAPGVWHGAPFAAGGPCAALVLLASGSGREDTHVVRFPDTPVAILPARRS